MTQQATAPVCAPVRRGFGQALRCIHCGEAGNVNIHLADLTDTGSLHCNECDADFSLDDVREAVAAWQKVLDWVSLAPALEE